MALVIVHNDTKLFVARKNFPGDFFDDGYWGLTSNIGEVQTFSKKGTATRKVNAVKQQFQEWRDFGDLGKIPSDDFTIYNVELVLGDPVG